MAILNVDTGKAITTGRLIGTSPSQHESDYVAWGTGSGTTAHGDTTLFTEDSGGSPAYARVAGASSQVTTTLTNDTYQVVGTITANAAKTITNAGLFDALTGGNLFDKADFTGIALNSGDGISFTWQTEYS